MVNSEWFDSPDCCLGRQLLLLVCFGFLDVVLAVLPLEALYSAGGIDVLLLAGVERMAHRADFRVYFLGGTAGLKSIAAAAVHHHLIVFRMYFFLHSNSAPSYLKPYVLYGYFGVIQQKFFVITYF